MASGRNQLCFTP